MSGASRPSDPYVRTFHQYRNIIELMDVLIKRLDYTKAHPRVHLVTAPDTYDTDKQEDYLRQIREVVESMNIGFHVGYRRFGYPCATWESSSKLRI